MPSISATALAGHVAPNPPANAFRVTDAIDIFQDYHTTDQCRFSSLALHAPFEPLCQDKDSLLLAMSGGGRIGVDAPFAPRGCDMRWFSTPEICAILSRFDSVNIIGDSMMRNMAVALHVLLRQDLVNGGVATWAGQLLGDPENLNCECTAVFENRHCAFHGIVNTIGVYQMEPHTLICPQETTGLIAYHHVLEHPIRQEDLDILYDAIPGQKPKKPVAFVMGHGLWNDLDKEKTHAWIHQAMNTTVEKGPWLEDAGSIFPRLFLTPSAAGEKKPDIFLARQGNIALARFEKAVGQWVRDNGMDFLGTYNMSIQAHNPDGTHGGMRNNLIKAMMIFNWLNALDTKTGWVPGS